MISKRGYVLILTSGGIDSTACINFYKKIDFKTEAIFVDYGQKAKSKELAAIKSIVKYFKIKLKVVRIKNKNKFDKGEVLGRNAFLIFTALLNFSQRNGIIALGIHSGTNYFDCSEGFTNQVNEIIGTYSQGAIKIGTPFLKFNKKEIYEYCISERVPIDLTYSFLLFFLSTFSE